MEFIINKKQEKELNALYAGIWTLKHSNLTLTEQDKELIRECIKINFEELDRMKTPFKIQNIVIALAETKDTMNKYFETNLNEKGIKVI